MRKPCAPKRVADRVPATRRRENVRVWMDLRAMDVNSSSRSRVVRSVRNMDLAKNSRLENMPVLAMRDGMERIAISTRDVRPPTASRTRARVEVFANQRNVSVRTDLRENSVRRRVVLEIMVRAVQGTDPAISKRARALAMNFSVTTIAAKRFDARRHRVFMEFVWASKSACVTRDSLEMAAK